MSKRIVLISLLVVVAVLIPAAAFAEGQPQPGDRLPGQTALYTHNGDYMAPTYYGKSMGTLWFYSVRGTWTYVKRDAMDNIVSETKYHWVYHKLTALARPGNYKLVLVD